MPVRFRPFRNPDPPALVSIWNECFTSRGAAYLNGTLPLEHLVLSKPYFDPDGLILALENDRPVGFVHAGFAPDAAGKQLDCHVGAICALAVRPSHQHRGTGRELLSRAEAYLRSKGARTIIAGPIRPKAPFYWGLLWGSEPAGVLRSMPRVGQFLSASRYQPGEATLIYQRTLDSLPLVPDIRFPGIKRRCELQVAPRPVAPSWFEEVLQSPLDMLQFQLVQADDGRELATVRVWDMEHYAWRWHQPSAGIIDLQVAQEARGQGLAKFLLLSVLRYLQEQFYGLVEIHVPHDNAIARRLVETLGFAQVDEGTVYRKE